MKFRVRYRRARVTVEGEKPVRCAACPGNIIPGRIISLHHWEYRYSTKEVRANPQLALENTIPFCYIHHKIADHIKNLMADKEEFHHVMNALSYASIKIKKEELNV